MVDDLIKTSRWLCNKLEKFDFASPVTHVYNPLRYAREPFENFLRQYGGTPGRVLLLGMNPGPWGMAQTGVPFGEVSWVRDWLRVTGRVRQPQRVHPKRPVDGLACGRSEVSGKRLWGWAADRWGSAGQFFGAFMVLNYCPLMFMEESGRNRTPDKLLAHERESLFALCDEALRRWVAIERPAMVVGVGKFAEDRARYALYESHADLPIGRVLHPSPASPVANRGWAERADADLEKLGLGRDTGKPRAERD